MRFIAFILFMLLAAAPAFAQLLDKSDVITLSIGKITLDNISTDITRVEAHCFTYAQSADKVQESKMNDPSLWYRSGNAIVAEFGGPIANGAPNPKHHVESNLKISMYRQKDKPAVYNSESSYACKLLLFSNGMPKNSDPNGGPAWAKGSGQYFVKGSIN